MDRPENFQMDWEYTSALDGNVAMMGQLDLSRTTEFTLASDSGIPGPQFGLLPWRSRWRFPSINR